MFKHKKRKNGVSLVVKILIATGLLSLFLFGVGGWWMIFLEVVFQSPENILFLRMGICPEKQSPSNHAVSVIAEQR